MKRDVELPPRIPGMRFDRIVGRGGMSVVWKAYYERIDRAVAVKVMSDEAAQTGSDVRQFLTESRVMGELVHAGIVHAYDAGCVDGHYYFVMDLVTGYSFASYFDKHRLLSADEIAILADSVSEALAYAWDAFRVIHCDIKPENLMVDGDGLVKITDLGLCRVTGTRKAADEAKPDEIVGTPAYMSPEQIYAEPLDTRTDIYSFGATLYHLATGRLLFPGIDNDATMKAHCDPEAQAPDPRTLSTRLSGPLATFIAKLCVKDRDARYADWHAVLEDSARMQREEPLAPPEDVSSIALEV